MIHGQRVHRTESTGTAANAWRATRFVSAGPLALEWRISLADRWFAGVSSDERQESSRLTRPEQVREQAATAA